jgi:GMP synthase (glutamine-hydrolysing)
MKTALIIHHVAFEDAGSFLVLLKEMNFSIQEVNACNHNWAELNPLDADVCIVLGGPIGAYEDHHFPFLLQEVHFYSSVCMQTCRHWGYASAHN